MKSGAIPQSFVNQEDNFSLEGEVQPEKKAPNNLLIWSNNNGLEEFDKVDELVELIYDNDERLLETNQIGVCRKG